MSFKFEKLNVLLVEDVAPMRKLLLSVVQRLGVESVQECGDGKEAFELFQKENHDIIISDWVMNPMDGMELTKEVRTNSASPNRMVPIIMLTGYSAWPRVEKARDAGVTEFLVKPFSAEDIAKRIMHVVLNPRDFVENDKFFGPDRRRRVDSFYEGPFRREEEQKGYSPNGE